MTGARRATSLEGLYSVGEYLLPTPSDVTFQGFNEARQFAIAESVRDRNQNGFIGIWFGYEAVGVVVNGQVFMAEGT